MPHTLDDFFKTQDLELLRRVNGWDVRRSGDLVYLTLAARDGEQYTARFLCNDYSQQAPSVLFVNAEGSGTDPCAWPKGNDNFHGVVKPPPNCFLCMPLTREGLQHHGQWRGAAHAWHPERSLLDLFNYLSRLLDSPDYQGRGP